MIYISKRVTWLSSNGILRPFGTSIRYNTQCIFVFRENWDSQKRTRIWWEESLFRHVTRFQCSTYVQPTLEAFRFPNRGVSKNIMYSGAKLNEDVDLKELESAYTKAISITRDQQYTCNVRLDYANERKRMHRYEWWLYSDRREGKAKGMVWEEQYP